MQKKTRMSRFQGAALGIALLIASGPVLAAAGKAVFVTGPVSLERETTVPLKVKDPVEVGDIVVTGEKARAQLLMADSTKIALRAGSRFRIDDFALPPAVNAPAEATVVKTDGRSVASLLKGGFRTQTGAIGKIDKSAYEVRTPIGTLGIRGTDYTAVFCAGDCNDAPGLAPGAVVRDGLYLHVTAGRIVFRGGSREIEVGAGETIFIPLSGARPEPLQNPPAFLIEDGAGPLKLGALRSSAKGIAVQARELDNNRRGPQSVPGAQPEGAAGGADTVRQPVTGTDPNGNPADITGGKPTPQRRDIAFSILQLAQPIDIAAVESNVPASYDTDFSGDVTRFAQDLARGIGMLSTIDIGTSTVVESGALAGTSLRWGRWSGGAISLSVADQTFTEDLSQRSLHWIDSGNAATPPQMPTTGIATYTAVGNTSPTDNAGNVGVLNAATFSANFTAQTVTSTLDLTVNTLNWVVAGTGTIGNLQLGDEPHQFSGAYTGTINPVQSDASGSFAGFFSQGGGGTPGIPGTVGLTYSLIDGSDALQVNGTVALKNP